MTDSVEPYLWDRSGEVDRDIERLESLMSELRYQPQPLAWEHIVAKPRRRIFRLRYWAPLAVAAVLLIGIAFSWRSRFNWQSGEPWAVAAVAGSPRIADVPFSGDARLPVGQVLETDDASRATLHVAELGVLDVEPNSRVRLLRTTAKRHSVALDYGTVTAYMWAPPFSLSIETESAALFDLGCSFSLHAEKNGLATVQVLSGWISFQDGARKIVVPAGGEAIARPGVGPGTPYFTASAPAFKRAVADYDSHPNDASARDVALDAMLHSAAKRDAYTLLTLFEQVGPEQRPRLLDRLATFVPIPAGFTRGDVLSLRSDAINHYWEDVHKELHLDSPKSWIMKWTDIIGH
jgi:hypothetical protein